MCWRFITVLFLIELDFIITITLYRIEFHLKVATSYIHAIKIRTQIPGLNDVFPLCAL